MFNRKKREKEEPHGRIIFYEPKKPEDAAKYALLKAYGVEVRHLGFKLAECENNEDCDEDLLVEQKKADDEVREYNKKIYTDFYWDALVDIEREMKK